MKSIIVLLIVVSVALAQKQYTNKFDNVDIDAILKNPRILTNYIKCLLDKGNCTAEGRELKRTLPDALVSGCKKCNPNQKQSADKVINFLRKERPVDWGNLIAKYDPEGNYQRRFQAHQASIKV